MTWRTALVLAAAGSLGWARVGRGGAESQIQGPTFGARAAGVSVDVSVIDNGKPVGGLVADRFVLLDNGVRQQVQALELLQAPVDVTFVVDVSLFSALQSSYSHPLQQFEADARRMAGLLHPDDRLREITFAGAVREVRAMAVVTTRPQMPTLTAPGDASPESRVGGALLLALTWPEPADRSHLVVLFSRDWDEGGVLSPDQFPVLAARSDAVLQVVLAPPLKDLRTYAALPFYSVELMTRAALTVAAEATGGGAHVTGDSVGAFRDILEAFRSSYVLRYTAQGVPATGWHTLAVTVPSCPTCTIHTRKGYFAG